MAGFLNIIKKVTGEKSQVLNVLRKLDAGKTPVRVEVENSLHRFVSVLALRSNTVVLAKPPGLEKGLEKGSGIRFKVPQQRHEIRLEVATPHFNLSNGNSVFLCQPPEKFCESTRRGEDRYNTTRFNNLLLEVDGLPGPFRIVDLSPSGCRIYYPGNSQEILPTGNSHKNSRIRLGNKITVEFKSLTPRSHFRKAVGLEFVVLKEGDNQKYLTHLISSLKKAEMAQNASDSLE